MIILKLVLILLLSGTSTEVYVSHKLESSINIFSTRLVHFTSIPTDMIILFDESMSTTIKKDYFTAELNFAEMIARMFRVSPNDTRMAIISFASRTSIHLNFISSDKGNMCNFLHSLNKIDAQGGWTFTADALKKAEELFSDSHNRPNSQKLILLITDGKSNGENPIPVAKKLKAKGVNIFAVGIGATVEEELKEIVSSAAHLLLLENFTRLDKITETLKKDIVNNYYLMEDSMKQCLSNCLDRGECCDKNAVCSCGRDGIYSCTCRKGFYGTGSIGNCLKCPRGSFSSELGQEKCHLCPLHSDTLHEGAMSIHECHCNLGYSGSRSIIGFCKPQQCPKLIPPEGGSLLPSRCGNSLHDECSFFCSSPLCPYNGSIVGCIKQSSRKEQDNSRCLISGQWTIPKFKCEMAKCPQLKDVKNGYYSCDDFSSKIGTKCNLNCHIGFEIAGGTGLAVCLQNGSWQKDDSYCKKIFCRKLELSHELTLKPPNCSHYDQPYLAECEYSCKPGYALVTSTSKLGNSTSVIKGKCGVTGQWIVSHDYFRCLELHDCKNKQCENGGSCEITVDNSSFCNCLPGFTGISCEKSINSECEENFCLNNGSCKDNSICICQPGFSGVICEININDCSPDSCINGGTCQDGINSYHCLCPEGIQGKSCEIVPNLCISEPCQNNGRCRNKFKTFHCCCAAGFTGSVCDINVDDCASRPCFNGGVCQDGINNYTCSCPSGFFGPNCENIINNCLSSPCKNGGTCKNLILAMKCFCLPGFTGNLCEIELSRKFDLIFPGKSTSDYVFLRYKEHLNALTVAFWMQTNMKNKIRGTPVSLSYITPDSKIEVTNAFTIYDVTNIILFLHGLELHTNICANSDELWHHYAITWDSFDGTWATYVDGKRWAGGSGAAVGHVFWSGTFVLGQEQDLIEGGFTLAETFEGKLSQFNVWNFILSHEAIQQLSQSCGYSGNVIAWAEVKNYTRGNVKATFNAEICEHIGYFRNGGLEENNTKVNFCSDKNHGNLNLNKSLKECEQNNYNCHNGFTDPFCKYDINECFFDNGNCSHSCLNLHGSYKCLCPPGFFLSHDQRNCETTRYCFHEGLFYMDDEEWEQNCQTCRCKNGRVKCSAIVCSNHNCSREELSVLLPHQCCKQCIQLGSKCTVNHKNIYLTFDDATFKFVAACRHILAQDCSKGTVSIFIENEDASSERKNLIVESDCLTIEVFSTGRLLINDRESVYPFYLSNQINIYPSRYSYHFNDYKTIKFKHSSASSYMLVTKEEVIISWNSLGVVEIFVPDKMKRQMCGLCGNMNGDSSDDFLTNSLMTSSSILEFTSSWQVDSGNCKILERNPKGTPSQARADGVCKSSWQKLRAKKLCQELRSEHFHKCYQVVNSQGFYDLCVQDVCSCNRTDRCQCNAINAYVVECAKFNVSPDSKWKERDDCVTCQDQMVFDQCGPPCPKTCEKDIKDVRCQISSCKIGCRCPLHLALHDGKCIHPADCPLDYQINKTV